MDKKLKQYLRQCGCSIEARSQSDDLHAIGNFILAKWCGTAFTVWSTKRGLELRVKQLADWDQFAPPCLACSEFLGVGADKLRMFAVGAEQYFEWLV